MCGEFGEVSGIIDLVINFLAGGTLFLNSYDTLSYADKLEMIISTYLSQSKAWEFLVGPDSQLPTGRGAQMSLGSRLADHEQLG